MSEVTKIKIDSRLEAELKAMYELLTGEDGKDVIDFLKNDFSNGKEFEAIRKWLEEEIPESNENKYQRKVLDILFDRNVISKLPSEVKAYIKKIVDRVYGNRKGLSTQMIDLDNTEKNLDSFINKTNTLRNKFQKLDSYEYEKTFNLVVGSGATSITFLACVILVVEYYYGLIR